MGRLLPSPNQTADRRVGATRVEFGSVRASGEALRGRSSALPDVRPCSIDIPARGRASAAFLCKNSGFSLVEVLVAVIVLAVGLLGMAGLQIATLKANDSAYYRTLASQAILDVADRMRADPAAVLGSNGLRLDLQSNTCASTPTVRWKKDFCAYGLPVPVDSENLLAINCVNGTRCGAGNCEITVRWEDSRAEAGYSSDRRNAAFSVCTRLPAL